MARQLKIDNVANRYIRGNIRQERNEAQESQEDFAKTLQNSRVSVYVIERRRVEISATELGWISAHYEKPISYFYTPRVSIEKDRLSKWDEELFFFFFNCLKLKN